MADDPAVVERGIRTAAAERRDLAVRRAEVTGQSTVGLAAAGELGVLRRRVHVLTGRQRAGEGLAPDLLPGTPRGGRGGGRLPDEAEAVVREVLRARYLTRQRRTVASACRDIARQCQVCGLRVPSRGTVPRWVAGLDPVRAVSARERR